jgi:hypothetical protein
LKVTPSFCFPFKIPDDPNATIQYITKELTHCPKSVQLSSQADSKQWVNSCPIISTNDFKTTPLVKVSLIF